MKLHESIKQLTSKFGQNVLTEKRLANLVADLNGYEECPAMKQVMTELVKEGFNHKLFTEPKGLFHTLRSLFGSKQIDLSAKAQKLADVFAQKTNFKTELVQYAFDCLLWSVGKIENINEPAYNGRDAMSNGAAAPQPKPASTPVVVPDKSVGGAVPDISQAVDLGLPSGTLWAPWNVGATKPSEGGANFA